MGSGLDVEDLSRVASVLSPTLSPDGSVGVVVVRRAGEDGDGYRSRLLWCEGGRTRYVTAGPDDGSPAFSNDGRRLWFVRRGGKDGDHIMAMPVGGGEPEPVGPRFWGLAGLVPVPGTEAVIVAARGVGAVPEPEFPRAYARWQWQFDGTGYFPPAAQILWWVEAGQEPRALTEGPYDCELPAVAADGSFLVFSRVADETRAEAGQPDLFRLDLEKSVLGARRLTEGPGIRHAPAIAADGTVYFYGHHNEQGPATQGCLLRLDRSGRMSRVELPPDLAVGEAIGSDWNAGAVTSRPQVVGTRVVVQASRRGRTGLWLIDGDESTVIEAPVAVVHEVAAVDSPDGPLLLFTGSSLDRPPEVYRSVKGTASRLSEENAWAADRLAPVRPLTATAADGLEIPAFLVGDPSTAQRPLVLYVHGGPHGAYGETVRFDAQVMAGRGYRVLLVNPRGSMSYGQAFADAVRGDWGGQDRMDLETVLDHVLSEGSTDEARVYITGASYGGFMTAWMVGHTHRFAAASTVVPVINLLSFYGTSDIGWWFTAGELGTDPWTNRDNLWTHSPLAYADQVRTPTQVVAGEADRRCPIEQAEQFYTALKHFGVETEFLRYPGSHGFGAQGRPRDRQDRLQRLLQWFGSHARTSPE